RNWEKKPSILKGLHELQGLKEWSEERWSELRATYLGMVARVDHQFSGHGDYTTHLCEQFVS
ncbi:MAG: hypothetical protein JSU92_05070, partial [Deltaproteobacteria bacterium]